MKLIGIDRRLAALEERAKPRMIATLADFVLWCAEDEPDDVEFSPQMQEFVEESLNRFVRPASLNMLSSIL